MKVKQDKVNSRKASWTNLKNQLAEALTLVEGLTNVIAMKDAQLEEADQLIVKLKTENSEWRCAHDACMKRAAQTRMRNIELVEETKRLAGEKPDFSNRDLRDKFFAAHPERKSVTPLELTKFRQEQGL